MRSLPFLCVLFTLQECLLRSGPQLPARLNSANWAVCGSANPLLFVSFTCVTQTAVEGFLGRRPQPLSKAVVVAADQSRGSACRVPFVTRPPSQRCPSLNREPTLWKEG